MEKRGKRQSQIETIYPFFENSGYNTKNGFKAQTQLFMKFQSNLLEFIHPISSLLAISDITEIWQFQELGVLQRGLLVNVQNAK